MDIIRLKKIEKKEKISVCYSCLLRRIFKKYIIFAIVNLCVICFSWWYLSCFYALYKNTLIYLLINTFISFAIALLYPFIYCFIPAALRYYTLGDLTMDREIVYKISRIIQIL